MGLYTALNVSKMHSQNTYKGKFAFHIFQQKKVQTVELFQTVQITNCLTKSTVFFIINIIIFFFTRILPKHFSPPHCILVVCMHRGLHVVADQLAHLFVTSNSFLTCKTRFRPTTFSTMINAHV